MSDDPSGEVLLPADLDRIIHFTELNSSDWWVSALDRIILAVLWSHKEPADLATITSGVGSTLGSQVMGARIATSLGKMVASGQVFELSPDRFKISEEMAKSLGDDRRKVRDQEAVLHRQLGDLFRAHDLPVDDEEAWEDFDCHYLVPLLHRIGAHVYEAFSSGAKLADHVVEGNSELLVELERKYGVTVRLALAAFMNPDNADVRSYVLRRLTGQFAREAAGLTETELRSMRPDIGKTIRLDLFLDTNFLFSLLELHENPGNRSSGDLISLIVSVSGHVSTRLLVIKETVEEARRVLREVMFQLKNRPVSGSIASAANSFHANGLVSSYLAASARMGGKSTLTPDSFFGPYEENLLTSAKDKGVTLYTPAKDDYSTRQDVVDAIMQLIETQKLKRAKGPKPYDANAHDMILWHLIKDIRPGSADSPIDARSWIVTLDYGLMRFDRNRRSHPPICIMPADLIAMLQFWVPRSDELDKALVGALREPLLFLDFDREAEKATIDILAAISRYSNAGDMSPSLVRSVVSNKALRAAITPAMNRSAAEAEALVESAVIEESKEIERRLAEATAEKARAQLEMTKLSDEVAAMSAVLAQSQHDLAQALAQAQTDGAAVGALGESLRLAALSKSEREEKFFADLAEVRESAERAQEQTSRMRSWSALVGAAILAGAGCWLIGSEPLRHVKNRAIAWSMAALLAASLFALLADLVLTHSVAYKDSKPRTLIRRWRKVIMGVLGALVVGVVANFFFDALK